MKPTALAPLVILVLLAGCRGEPAAQIPDDPDELTLFSIDGTETWKQPTAEPPLYGCPVLGRVEIGDPARRREIMAAVRDGIRNAPTEPKACFFPRHMLRVGKDGKTVDVVICFQCDNYRLYRVGTDAGLIGGGQISSAGQPALDKILTDAGIPLAPRLGE